LGYDELAKTADPYDEAVYQPPHNPDGPEHYELQHDKYADDQSQFEQYDQFNPFPHVESHGQPHDSHEYVPLSEDYHEWGDDIMKQFESQFREKYPDIAGELVYDEKAGMWTVKNSEYDNEDHHFQYPGEIVEHPPTIEQL